MNVKYAICKHKKLSRASEKSFLKMQKTILINVQSTRENQKKLTYVTHRCTPQKMREWKNESELWAAWGQIMMFDLEVLINGQFFSFNRHSFMSMIKLIWIKKFSSINRCLWIMGINSRVSRSIMTIMKMQIIAYWAISYNQPLYY